MNKLTTLILLCWFGFSLAQIPLTNTFTYQGELKSGNTLANGSYDFEFSVFDVQTGGVALETIAVNGVTVTNGVFTTPITLNNDLFTGNKIWLDIGVRANGSGNPFDPLSPRQEVTSSPYAIHAQFVGTVGADAVTGVQIQDNSVTNNDLQSNSVDSTTIVDNSITSSDIAVGAITSTELADNSVTSVKIVDGSVGMADIDVTQVQRRVSSVCSNEEYLAGINQDGSIICRRLPANSSNLIDYIPRALGQGYILNISIAINQNNLPVISYLWVDSSVQLSELRVVACATPSCSSANSFVMLDNLYRFGVSKIIIPSNNLPIIAYVKKSETTAAELQVISCTTADCSTFNTPVLLDTLIERKAVGFVQEPLKLIIGSNGLPIISYFTSETVSGVTNKFLRVIACLQMDCSTFSPPVTLLSGTSFTQTDVIVGPSGMPIVAVNDSVNTIVIVCTSLDCSTFDPSVVVPFPYANQSYDSLSMALNINGLPIIALGKSGSAFLISCSVLDCSSISTYFVDFGGKDIKVFIGANGKPIISHFNSSTYDIRVVRCLDAACSNTLSKITIENTTSSIPSESDAALNQNGLPVIAYFYLKSGPGDSYFLKVFSCGTESCQN